MKAPLFATISILALAIASTSALAVSQRLGPGNKTITFSEVSRTDGTPDDGTCASRYGESFTTINHPDSTDNALKRSTDKGHDILVTSIGGSVSGGIFSIVNEYEIIFPDDDTNTPVEVKLAATGMVGSQEASGVFSDGVCRGSFHIAVESN
ncbi:hypothetical protein GCM10007094_26290 [Pseudovibrio japonicus]|uniref:Uncharacterized protein n=1 Tax=Pseudovibrio japonicus TaxID=366534 RepID=A0ABQ3EMC1_9HYPH|nr:hypothetical protein [Pseudovibrio japonicus]GHB35460.1 hypothetical protein GCM10007094_26290 [Pseudovibrio japonicus]